MRRSRSLSFSRAAEVIPALVEFLRVAEGFFLRRLVIRQPILPLALHVRTNGRVQGGIATPPLIHGNHVLFGNPNLLAIVLTWSG
jgi:hypothetical protein